ncbi:RidA family protein [Mangrovicella endophytica]|uniref:RidA family protein n=1 Tax=Mangrovicella endophytica TaxID=2066697 RepID=UPI000C9E02BB|nr:RidA family protein [Mangrovicella endophytica]
MQASTPETAAAPSPYAKLAALGLDLPAPPSPIANFVTFVESRQLLFLSGQGPLDARGVLQTGKVGGEVSIEAAYGHARLTGLNLLGVMHAALGDLSRVTRIVKLLGFVNAVPDFGDHPRVINGCSDLFMEVFGPIGAHARSAIGVGSLPGNISVEIEAVIEIAA